MSVFEESKSYRPFKYSWAVDSANKQEVDMYWHIGQIQLQDDLQQYHSISGLATPTVSHSQNKNILDKTLCLFTEMDKSVGGGYTKLLQYIKNNEIRNVLLRQANREVTHQHAYALCAETFGFSAADWIAFADYVEMVEKLDVMGDDYTNTDMRDELKASILITQILLGEGIGLFGAFATLLNKKRWGKVIGFNDVNEWSLRDEQEHVTNNIRILEEMLKDLTTDEKIELRKVTLEFVEAFRQAEYRYLELVFEMGGAEGLSLEEMKSYIDYLCALRLYQLKLLSITAVPHNPLEWMEWILSAAKHANFFEKKVVDYTHGGLKGEINYEKYLGALDETIS